MKITTAYMLNVELDNVEHADDPKKPHRVNRVRKLAIVVGPDDAQKSVCEYALRHKQLSRLNPKILGVTVYPALGRVNFIDHSTLL